MVEMEEAENLDLAGGGEFERSVGSGDVFCPAGCPTTTEFAALDMTSCFSKNGTNKLNLPEIAKYVSDKT